MFKGYCSNKNDRMPPVSLKDAREVYNYIQLHKNLFHEIRIVNPADDSMAVYVIDGKIVFPEEWKKFND